jgi:hypothetical protein
MTRWSLNQKKEWEAFKKTKRYRDLKEKMSLTKEKMRKKFSISKEEMKQKILQAKKEYNRIDREKVERELAKAKELLQELNFNIKSKSNTDSDDLIINGKKIKIKKRLEIKVPKGATFNLNTRHCKVKLPNTVASGNVKYGTFDINNLIGGKLTVDYSKVNINNLNACTLFLNNVTDAKIASVTNTTMRNNSSGINIIKVNENVNVSHKFGELTIDSFNPNFKEFILNLSQSDAVLYLGTVPSKFEYQVDRIRLDNRRTVNSSSNPTTNNRIKVSGDYSTLVIK